MVSLHSNMPRIVVVFGATGTQGGAVVDALLSSNPDVKATFTIRAVTRDPSSQAAQALKARVAEVAKADLSDRLSLQEALKGAEIVFAVTDAGQAVGYSHCPSRKMRS